MTTSKIAIKGLWAGALLILGLGFISKAQAAGNPDTMTISVTPSVTYAVTITSVNPSGYQFGTVALAASTISTWAIGLRNTGTIWEYFSLGVSNSSPDGWTPGAAGVAANNVFGLIAELNATQPADAAFVGGDAVTGSIPGAAAAHRQCSCSPDTARQVLRAS